MKSLRLSMFLVACCVISTPIASWAAETTPARPAAPAATPAGDASVTKPAAESAAPNSDEDLDDEDAAAKAASTADKGKGGKGSSPQRFTPTEQVRADFDVSFPIDI